MAVAVEHVHLKVQEAWALINEFLGLDRDFRTEYSDNGSLYGKIYPDGDVFEHRWYSSGMTDFSIYEGDDYLYYVSGSYEWSGAYILKLVGWLQEQGIQINGVLDHGAGLGLTSLTLASYLGTATYCDNPAGRQLDFNRWVSKKYGDLITVVDEADVAQIGHVDLLVCYELFEHFKDPATELRKLVRDHSPRIISDSTSFTIKSAGHFDQYVIDGETLQGYKSTQTSRRFRKVMEKELGYKQVDTGFWNARPRIFVQQ